jgi:hypothetical protein
MVLLDIYEVFILSQKYLSFTLMSSSYIKFNICIFSGEQSVFAGLFALGGIHFALGGVFRCMALPMSTLWPARQCRQEAEISAAKIKRALQFFFIKSE